MYNNNNNPYFNILNNFNNQNIIFNSINQMNQINMMNMQINQINMLNNQMNQINNINALNLLNNQMRQMNKLNSQINEINNHKQQYNNQEIIKEFPDIKEERKIIIFKRNDNSKKIISIPVSLKKNELYLIANKYKKNEYSKIYLYNNKTILEDDESNINDILNGEEIYIVEQLKVDETYYDNYLKKHSGENLLNIVFDFIYTPERRKSLGISSHTKIKEMIKIFLYEMKIPEDNKNDFNFLYNGIFLKTNERLTLYEKGITSISPVIVIKKRNLINSSKIEGKQLNVNVEYKKETVLNISIGTLNKIKDLFTLMEIDLSSRNIFIKKIKINKKKYERNDERTFSSVGIVENFTYKIISLNLNEKEQSNIF